MDRSGGVDEFSLRDAYLILKRWTAFVIAVPLLSLGLGLVAFMLLPRSYSSQGLISVVSSKSDNQLLTNLPSGLSLAQSFSRLLGTRSLADFDAAELMLMSSRFDDKQNLWTLQAAAGSSEEATRQAERLMKAARAFFADRTVAVVTGNIDSSMAQLRVDLETARSSLDGIQSALKSNPTGAGSNPVTAAGLEVGEVDALTARATNPAVTSLSLDESRLRSAVAQFTGRIRTLEKLRSDRSRIEQLVGQAMRLQVLVSPAAPLTADSPRAGLMMALFGVLGLLVGLIWPFVVESIRDSRTDLASRSGLKPVPGAD
jgi:hypothetical protein